MAGGQEQDSPTTREFYDKLEETRASLSSEIQTVGNTLGEKIEKSTLAMQGRVTTLEVTVANEKQAREALFTQVVTLQTSHDVAMGHISMLKWLVTGFTVLMGSGGILGVAVAIKDLLHK